MRLATQPLGLRSPGADAWRARLQDDHAAVDRLVPVSLRHLHETVLGRAVRAGASALILSGSTARGCRTEISDLDYHLVGEKVDTRDLSAEVDLHTLSHADLDAGILAGDDFVHWSLRFGRNVFDDGTLLAAVRLMTRERPWPDIERKRDHAVKSLALAARVVDSGDQDAALIQVRTALSLSARAYLLSVGEFPMSRAELPRQLVAAARPRAARALECCIYGDPALESLCEALADGQILMEEREHS